MKSLGQIIEEYQSETVALQAEIDRLRVELAETGAALKAAGHELERSNLVVAAARRYCNADSTGDAVNEWHALVNIVDAFEAAQERGNDS